MLLINFCKTLGQEANVLADGEHKRSHEIASKYYTMVWHLPKPGVMEPSILDRRNDSGHHLTEELQEQLETGG